MVVGRETKREHEEAHSSCPARAMRSRPGEPESGRAKATCTGGWASATSLSRGTRQAAERGGELEQGRARKARSRSPSQHPARLGLHCYRLSLFQPHRRHQQAVIPAAPSTKIGPRSAASPLSTQMNGPRPTRPQGESTRSACTRVRSGLDRPQVRRRPSVNCCPLVLLLLPPQALLGSTSRSPSPASSSSSSSTRAT